MDAADLAQPKAACAKVGKRAQESATHGAERSRLEREKPRRRHSGCRSGVRMVPEEERGENRNKRSTPSRARGAGKPKAPRPDAGADDGRRKQPHHESGTNDGGRS